MKTKRILLSSSLILGLSIFGFAQKAAPLLTSLTLGVWDGASQAVIDAHGQTAVVRHIPNGSLVTGVNYQLADGATITPDPHSLVGKWPEEITFTLKQKKRTQKLTVRLMDYVDPSEEVGGDWKLVWNDEFNGNEPDWNAWSKTPRNRANWGDCMTDDARLYEMKDGVVRLKGMANTILPNDTSKYLTGGLWGKSKRTFMLGRIDVRARYNSAKGFWPAIWLLPQADSRLYSENGEIDMVEHLNFDNFVYQTVHTGYTNNVSKISPKNFYTPAIDRDSFNIYTVEVYPDSLVYSVNGGEYSYTYPRLSRQAVKDAIAASSEANTNKTFDQFPFDRFDYYVVLSAQLGGQWVGEVRLKPEEVVSLDIDYVRYYRQK